MNSRRLVSVLFLDLVGWTPLAERLDPEPLQQLLERYYAICVTAVEQHGGVIEKFIGDAVMAVFGAERAGEDDAVRAVHTGARIRAQVTQLHAPRDTTLDVHCGIAAGEALVTESPRAGLRVVGDVVNLAARLQSAAPAGETYLNEVAMHLTRSRVELEAVPPLTLKGKREPVPAWRLVSTSASTSAPLAPSIPLVNREEEVDLLLAAYRRVVDSGSLHVLTMQGAPGVGKSRLVREMITRLSVAGNTQIAYATCSSYGIKGSYAALGPMLGTLLDRSHQRATTVGGNSRVMAVLSYLRPAGHSDAAATGSLGNGNRKAEPGVEEISWAVCELLFAVAAEPLVLIWDDLQWASPALQDLIGALMVQLRDRPVLMVHLCRPESTGQPPPWRDDPVTVLTVEPLTGTHMRDLVEALAVDQASTRDVVAHDAHTLDWVATESAGNPLFAELMVETLASGQPLDEAPPSIAAMVGAMIDRLPDSARGLLEAAAVVGPRFPIDRVRLLYTSPVTAPLAQLTQRRLVQPATEAGVYHFTQQLVHHVVYRRLGKGQRLQWHRMLAEDDPAPAFHLESAVQLMLDLNPDDPELLGLAGHAAEALLHEGTTALRRRDLPAASGLLERAVQVATHADDQPRAIAAVRLSDAAMLSGDLAHALATIRTVAQQVNDPAAQVLCQLQVHLLGMRSGQVRDVPWEHLQARLGQRPSDDLAWCRLYQVQMWWHVGSGQYGAAEAAVDAALGHARALPDAYEEDRLLVARCEISQWSPTPIAVKLTACAQLADRFAADRYLLVPVLVASARMRALTGEFDHAWALLAEARTAAKELGLSMGEVLVEQVSGVACSLAEEHAKAEQHYRVAVRMLEAAGYRPAASTMRVLAVRERVEGGDFDAPQELPALLAQLDHMDLRGRVLCLSTQARLIPEAGGELATISERVSQMVETTDDPCLRGDAYLDLARAHQRAGDHRRASSLQTTAEACYAATGATSAIRRARQWR